MEDVVIKKKENHTQSISPFCGNVTVVSTAKDNPKVDIAVLIDIKPTKAHYHMGFEEIYMVNDGTLTLELYNPTTNEKTITTLETNEVAMIPPGVHHKIIRASERNQLTVLCLPGFNPADEHSSDKL